jgi:hypothetical protein
MDSKQQPLQPEFLDLAVAQNLGKKKTAIRGNVIKSHQAVTVGIKQIESIEADPDQPKVFVHKTGEEIQKVEFQCTCGKTASLTFTYEDE